MGGLLLMGLEVDLLVGLVVDFVVVNSDYLKISAPSNGVNRVRRDPDRAELLQI